MNIIINNVGFSADEKLKTFIEQRVNKLSKFYNRIVDAEVFLKLENSGKVKDKIVEIKLNVPGKQLICKSQDKVFEAAVDECVSSLERQVKKYKDKVLAH